MHDQPRIKPLRRSDFFADQRSARPLVQGTVARGQLREDRYFYTGRAAPNQLGDTLPMPATAELLRRGQERFDIYCSPCHSRVGDGNGMIVQRGLRHPPSFHTEALRARPLGHYFDVMTNGFGAMPDYAAQIAPADRWAIAAYIRVLQYSQRAPLSDVPEDMRANIADRSSVTIPAPASTTMGETPTQPGAAGESPQREEKPPAVAQPPAKQSPQTSAPQKKGAQ